MPPIPAEQMSEAQKKAAAELTASRGSVRGPFVALMRSPELLDHTQRLGSYIRWRSALDLRLNRLAGMMVTRHWGNQYEWNGHRPHALEAGVTQATIDAIGEGRRPELLRDDEAAVYDFVTELYANRSVSDPTYAKAVGLLGEQGVVDLLAVIGYYATNAMIMNVARTPVPGGKPLGLTPMPQVLRPRDD
jgi:4-carboxymuconolactone decarboxylase